MAETPQPPAPAPAPTPAPVMDVVAPPQLAQPPADPATPTASAPSAPAPAKVDIPAPPKPKPAPKQGVTAAIIATVIIVLGLATLAVIAYIKQK